MFKNNFDNRGFFNRTPKRVLLNGVLRRMLRDDGVKPLFYEGIWAIQKKNERIFAIIYVDKFIAFNYK